METLNRHPEHCPHAAESDKSSEELRELLCGKRKSKHRIIFTIRDTDVGVLYVSAVPARHWSHGHGSVQVARPTSPFRPG